jgi:hypothetical protein
MLTCARRRRPGPGGPPCGGVAKGAAPSSGVGGGGWDAGFGAWPLPPSCQAEYASVTVSQTLEVMDQDLHRLEAWLGNHRCLAGVIRLSLPAHRCRPIVAVVAGGSILLGHGVAPRGVRYADRLKEWMNLAHLVGGECRCGECCVLWMWGGRGTPPPGHHLPKT